MRGNDAVYPDVVKGVGAVLVQANAHCRNRSGNNQFLKMLLIEILIATEPIPLLVVERLDEVSLAILRLLARP